IPCLDVSHGRVVKGVKFQGLRDAGDPAELSARYEAEGADELVLLDVSATTEARGTQVDTVRRVRAELSIPLTVGGGVRNAQNAQDLLEAGADKVSVNTAAVERPELVAEIATRFGSQCAVVAIDAKWVESPGTGDDKFEVLIRSGKESAGLDGIDWARRVVEFGAGELLLTSWDRDGTHEGYDLALVEAVAKAVPVPVIASGGAAHAGHLAAAVNAGADAVLAASIFHDREYTIGQVKRHLAEDGIEVRL
ncbi:MAG: imidazole glycerol phosphate synthase subunit HisF, partial [Pseudomonadota bacterium]|nr:imidazole glycerol phosphate synthase subunit HisF [Pseudomonadota bacterium]